MKRICLVSFAAASLVSLGACAGNTADYPSLARRDVERAPPAPPPATTPDSSTAPADPAIAARLPVAVESARAAHRRFQAAQARAEQTIAAAGGSAPGSDSWGTASVALAALESARSDAMIALADLDGLLAEARVNGKGGAQEIAAARDAVAELVSEEDRVLAALRGRMAG